MIKIDQTLSEYAKEAETALSEQFRKTEEIAFFNTKKVLTAFQNHRVDDTVFQSTSGYGFDDKGRDTLDEIWAEVFGCESALVRHTIVSGTHALSIGLFALLRPGDTLYSIAGKPYDTLEEVIGIRGEKGAGSLADFGISYLQTELKNDDFDRDEIEKNLKNHPEIRVVFIQRSKGYLNRVTLSVSQIGKIASFVKSISPDVSVVVDNCYGEFTEEKEPTEVGADLCIGSLIKNPGGGMAESGGYLCGTKKAVELCANRFSCVGIGRDEGASLGQNKNLYKGLFYAPHTVKEALKTALFASYLFEKMGYKTAPNWHEERHDIIQTVITGNGDDLCAFCRGIQAGSPVDSYVTPEPWAMPGYHDPVIMAAGAFTGGSSIELSADGPMREPYIVYFQGGLTYESGKIGILNAAQFIRNGKKQAE